MRQRAATIIVVVIVVVVAATVIVATVVIVVAATDVAKGGERQFRKKYGTGWISFKLAGSLRNWGSLRKVQGRF